MQMISKKCDYKIGLFIFDHYIFLNQYLKKHIAKLAKIEFIFRYNFLSLYNNNDPRRVKVRLRQK